MLWRNANSYRLLYSKIPSTMTDKLRKAVARKFRDLLDQGMPRKQALLATRAALRDAGLPSSQTQLYSWCRKFGVSTK